MTVIKVTDQSTRAQLAEAIAALRVKQERLPKQWIDQRAEIDEDIDALITQWLEAPA